MGAKSSKRYTGEHSADADNYPPVRPPSKSRKRAVPTQAGFKAIDDHAVKAPGSAGRSVKDLAKYLTTSPVKNDMEKIRAFYRWITDNISYDARGLKRNDNTNQQAQVVLNNRQAVCEGYSNVFLELCREAKIPCKKIHGFSKSLGYIPEVDLTEESRTNHAWNIVYVNGQWGAVDVTWGSGRVTDNYDFEKHYEEMYFLTDPKDFVVKHFPYMKKDMGKSQELQLLKKPLTLEEFNRAANPDTQGLLWGFKSSSHKNHKIEVDKEFTIKFKARKMKLQDVSCKLKRKNSRSEIKQCVLVRRSRKGRFTVKVSGTGSGTYDLELYGKAEGTPGKSLSRMIAYAVECQSNDRNAKPYPEHSGLWGIQRNFDVEKFGFFSDLKSKDVLESTNGSFELKVKAKEKTKAIFKLTNVDEMDMTKYCFGYFAKGYLTIRGNLAKEGYYKLTLFGNISGGTEYDYMGDILIECMSAHPDPPSYPKPSALWGAKPKAEEYGFTKQIYSKNIFTTGNGELNIRIPTTRDVNTSLKLETSGQNISNLTKNAISFNGDKMMLIRASLPKKGLYKLTLFAGHPDTPSARELDLVADFLIESKKDAQAVQPYPKPYSAAQTYSCILMEPLCGVLPANEKVRLRMRSKILTKLLINNETYEKKSGDVFDLTFTTPVSGQLSVSGNNSNDTNDNKRFEWLYAFEVK